MTARELATLPVRPRPITVDEYHEMAQAGIFAPDERVELLDGYLLPMTALGGPHVRVTYRLSAFFSRHVGATAEVHVQSCLRLNDRSEPEPDVMLLRPQSDDALEVPQASDALLVVEVSDSTLDFDRNVKRDRYAAAGIAETWIVSLPGRYVEAAHGPTPDGYAETRRFARGDARPLVPQLLPSLPPLDLDALFKGFDALGG
jgi:Uma2 family endonuclease